MSQPPLSDHQSQGSFILGRDQKTDGSTTLNQHRAFDLEVIKRKYMNIMDIITPDDLLRRLDNMDHLSAQESRSKRKACIREGTCPIPSGYATCSAL